MSSSELADPPAQTLARVLELAPLAPPGVEVALERPGLGGAARDALLDDGQLAGLGEESVQLRERDPHRLAGLVGSPCARRGRGRRRRPG